MLSLGVIVMTGRPLRLDSPGLAVITVSSGRLDHPRGRLCQLVPARLPTGPVDPLPQQLVAASLR